jgi:cytochrome d ubiquinol oxidase subunit II
MYQVVESEFFMNSVIFAVFFAIISTEFMAGSALLMHYSSYGKQVKRFIIPIWEITGTFFILYVVNVEALAPGLLPIVAETYIPLILLFMILYSTRNASIIFAEFIWKNSFISEKTLYRIYSGVTLILGAILLVIYVSIVTGKGISISAHSFNLIPFFSYLPDDGIILGSAIIFLGLSYVFYDMNRNKINSIYITAAGLVINAVSFAFLKNFVFYPYLAIPIVLTILIPVLYNIRGTYLIAKNKIFYIGVMSISVAIIERSFFPDLFGGTVDARSYFSGTAMQTAMFELTILMIIFVGSMMIFYFRMYFGGFRNAIRENDHDQEERGIL